MCDNLGFKNNKYLKQGGKKAVWVEICAWRKSDGSSEGGAQVRQDITVGECQI